MTMSASAIAMPTPTIVQPSIRPVFAVIAPARSRSPLPAQAMARTTRPPSSGSPGSRLSAARIRLRPRPRATRAAALPAVATARDDPRDRSDDSADDQ